MNEAINTDQKILKILQKIHQDLNRKSGHDFNWVQARQECTTWGHFQKMRSEIEQYVQFRNKFVDSHEFNSNPLNPEKFKLIFRNQRETYFAVGKQDYSGTRWIGFSFEMNKISIRSATTDFGFKPILATASLDEDGECWFCIEGQEGRFRRWQVVRKALEGIFF